LVVQTAASPKTRARYGLPCPEEALPLVLPAEELTPGANFAHEHRCPAVGNRDRTDARDLIEASRRLGERGQLRLDLGIDRGDVGVEALDPRQHARQQEPVMIGEVPVEGLLQPIDLAAHPCPCQLGQHLRVAFAGDQRGQHGPAGHPEDV
jgi:hypothetical protein